MRTTLSLDDDVAAALERLRSKSKGSFKELVNRALREGLEQMSERPARRKRFATKVVNPGRCYLPNLDDVAEALAAAEGEAFR